MVRLWDLETGHCRHGNEDGFTVAPRDLRGSRRCTSVPGTIFAGELIQN